LTYGLFLILSTSFSLKSSGNGESEGRTIARECGDKISRHSTLARAAESGLEAPGESNYFGLTSKGGPASGKERKQRRKSSTQDGRWLQVSTPYVTA
jgi:hypothetical protein